MLSISWTQRKTSYEFAVVGSGYGGAITAARIATALNQPHGLCILERGMEWEPGKFPSDVPGILRHARGDANPLGLYEFLNYSDISVIKGSGLGGTSLINANVAIVPDREVFELAGWPRSMGYGEMQEYYRRARAMLGAGPVPGAKDLAKVRALQRRADQLHTSAVPLDLAVNFKFDGPNDQGVVQRPCTLCGDCISGCNFSAKNTLYMNYLPLAAQKGADIFTQTKVEWIEKLPQGGWRIHGQHYENQTKRDKFSLDSRNVILAAGSINSTEILLRSEMHGLKTSPLLGTGFGGNGDFFGLAYNGSQQTNVLGYGQRQAAPQEAGLPGPSIVGAVRYNGSLPVRQRITVEDFSFPSAYIAGAKAVFAALRGDDTRIGDEAEQRERVLRDFHAAAPYQAHGALNHTMLYLVMGYDDARGTMHFDAPWHEPDGRMTIEWDNVGQQTVFTRINEELRRHARALDANYISNPTWSVFRTRHLVTAHPLGGCPVGEDYLHGAADEFGRVFSGDGSVHDGLFVADGALIPSALGVNPFLTISALAERIADRKIRQMNGEAYPKPATAVAMTGIDALDVIAWDEASIERLFRRSSTLPIDALLNRDAPPVPDVASRTVRNPGYWKGFFPKGHNLNAMSSAIFTGFKKEFRKQGGRYTGITSDTDGRIRARNSLEEITADKKQGTLEAGKYILLRYLDPPWTGFYDIFKVISDDLILGRVYLGDFPNGMRIFSFAMSRKYGFAQMTVADHDILFRSGAVPTKEVLNGVWRMDIVSNNNHLGSAAYLEFDLKPDGRLESRYRLMGLIEGLVVPTFTQDHFQLDDFTPFHDEIRQIDGDFMVGRYVSSILPDLSSVLNGADLGLLHTRPGSREFGFFYTLTRMGGKTLATSPILAPFLDARLPDGIGLSFDEEMTGWFFENQKTEGEGRQADQAIAALLPGDVPCSFQVKIHARDVNEFVDGLAHEAGMKGTIRFGFKGTPGATFPIDEQNSRFQYFVVNEATGEAEMRYHIEFLADRQRFLFYGRKYMQRTGAGGANAIRELLEDYTTLFCHVYRMEEGGKRSETGLAWLKFRTFEDLAAVGNLAGFLGSFTVTGTTDPLLQLRARMRFLAFSGQFVQREYDPLSPDMGQMEMDVRAEVRRGADSPDYFSTRPTADLQTILRDAQTLPLESLLNTGAASLDLPNKRIHRDLFWKGSFAKDTIVGREERIRNAGASAAAARSGAYFAGGAFWKRFDKIRNATATGLVINYDLRALPGDPEVRMAEYPDNNRRYFRKGQKFLLLTYRNDPYRPVYDAIKVLDENNAIGVMHLGEYPNGIEFATFVMARYSYPLEHMSVEDHKMIFAQGLPVPTAQQLRGEWNGDLILMKQANAALMTRPRPLKFRLSAGAENRFQLDNGAAIPVAKSDLRLLDADTIAGKSTAAQIAPELVEALRGRMEPYAAEIALYYLLKRA
jgi:cholesterol oxidase